MLIVDCDVVLPDRVIRNGAVLAADGKILYAGPVGRLQGPLPTTCTRIVAEGMLACPALWENHLHGCGGVSTENMTGQSLLKMARFLSSKGIGAFMPTTVSDERHLASLGEALESTADRLELRGRVPGMHVEGPFVANVRRGAIPEKLLRAPSIETLQKLVALSRGKIRVMTYAPELPGAAAIAERLTALGILPSLGHSAASYNELRACEGISPLSVTHLWNGMSGVSHREPGLAQWALLNREVFTELNCDGTHVHDAAVHLTLRARPWERIVVISDAVAPAGMPADGPAPALYGKPLVARGSGLFYEDSGVLVGSRFLVRDCIGRLVADFKVPVAGAVAMATLNPARLLGFERKGALLPGYDADVALLSRDFQQCAFLAWEGRILFEDPGRRR
jgi:N-acetylglucosamine-6-phosphate deacetylase